MRRIISQLMLLLFINQVASMNLWAQSIITAQVTNVSGSQIVIDQGSSSGLKVGTEGVVYYIHSMVDLTVRVSVALVKVISVAPNTARLQIIDSTVDIEEGYLVELSIMPETIPITPQAKKGGSKWWIWLLVAAAGGGVAAAVGGGGGGGGGTPTPTTGTISIDIPAN